MTIFINPYWWGVDVTDQARNWTSDGDTNVRRANTGEPLKRIAEGINHFYGQTPRIIFQQAQSMASAGNTVNKDPCYDWVYNDNFEGSGAEAQRISIISCPRTSYYNSAQPACAEIDGVEVQNTGKYETNSATLDYTKVFYTSIYRLRDGTTYTEEERGVTTANGFVILDCCVEEWPSKMFDDGTTHAVNIARVNRGDPITAEPLEMCRDSLHHARTRALPIMFGWSATGRDGTPSASGPTGIKVTSTSLVNLLDETSTERTADTPGPICPAYLCGRGNESQPAGKKVKCAVRVNGTSYDNDVMMTVRFEGPNHVNNNWVEINIAGSNTAETDWEGDSTSYVYLNSNCADYGAVGLERNKIDIYASINSGTGYIYGLRGWMVYE